MTREQSLEKLAGLQARHAVIAKLVEREHDPERLRLHAAELESMSRELEKLRLEFLQQLARTKAA